MGARQSTPYDWTPVIEGMCNEFEDPDDKRRPREYPRDCIKVDKKIGSGKFGSVSHCTIKDADGSQGGEPIQAVCKTFKSIPKGYQQDILTGTAQMAQLENVQTVVNMIGVYSIPKGPSLLLLEFCDCGSLDAYLVRKIGLSTADKLEMLAQVADGMSELAGRNFVHGSVCLKNILVAEGGKRFKISDWGARQETVRYLAQELLQPEQEAKHTLFSDIWAYGITAFEIFGDGKPAYPDNWDDHQVKTKILGGYRPKNPDTCPDKLFELLKNTWNAEPEQRPEFFWLRGELEDHAKEAREKEESQ
eukprot:m.335312 g.335312  ORF g.335312 m.335312 type:complete len:304 (-) comp17566_c0_seq1:1845-2756(-)